MPQGNPIMCTYTIHKGGLKWNYSLKETMPPPNIIGYQTKKPGACYGFLFLWLIIFHRFLQMLQALPLFLDTLKNLIL